MMTIDQIVEESLKLPMEVRAELVERILLASHAGVPDDIEQAWKRETRSRIADIQSGKVEGIPGDEVTEKIRKRVGR